MESKFTEKPNIRQTSILKKRFLFVLGDWNGGWRALMLFLSNHLTIYDLLIHISCVLAFGLRVIARPGYAAKGDPISRSDSDLLPF